MNHNSLTDFQVNLDRMLSEAIKAGAGREALTLTALTLQQKLAGEGERRHVPYASSLEVIMRAVHACLENGNTSKRPLAPDMRNYIKAKMRYGTLTLLGDIGERS